MRSARFAITYADLVESVPRLVRRTCLSPRRLTKCASLDVENIGECVAVPYRRFCSARKRWA
jgi:hypothetical protein